MHFYHFYDITLTLISDGKYETKSPVPSLTLTAELWANSDPVDQQDEIDQ